MGFLAVATLTLAQAAAAAPVLTAKPLPGNTACAFPAVAQKQRVTGPVRFVARITPEGATESVEIKTVPFPKLGFEEAVRSCIADWRFEPAGAAETGLRQYDGRVRYRREPANEVLVRRLLESLAAAWNAGDKGVLEDLETRREEVPGVAAKGEHLLHQQVQAAAAAEKCRVELDAEDVKPDYPETAKEARVERIVILECVISPEGRVTHIKVLRSIPLLDQAAIQAVSRWEYTPTLLAGVAVPVIMTVTVNFRLR